MAAAPARQRSVSLVTNGEIAAHLFLSRRTVQTHVSHILAKLDLHSRTDIAREASRRDHSGPAGEAEPATGAEH